MTRFVTSADGTRIAYERVGDGPATLVLVGGMFCDRRRTGDLARALAQHLDGRFAVVDYDRRGRGESSDTMPYDVEREIDDLRALVAASGGEVALYGHSSGAGLALRAAGARLPVTRLVLHEPPYGADDAGSTAAAKELTATVGAAIAEGRPGDAIRAFMAASGLPPEVVDGIAADPSMLELASTMPYDLAVMGDEDGGTIPKDLVGSITAPTMVVAGSASPDFFRTTAKLIETLLPDGQLAILDDQDHTAPPEVVAPVVARFIASA